MARFFGYTNEYSYNASKGRKKIEAGILSLFAYIRKMKNTERYIVEKSKIKVNHWVVTDRQTTLVCVFENKKFNDTQEIKYIEDPENINAAAIAAEVNQMSEWLMKNHPEKLKYR